MAHVKVTIEIPTDCDPVTAQRINQVCRAVMDQFPGIDDGPQHPFRMFLTTLNVYQDVLDETTKAKTDEPEPDPSAQNYKDIHTEAVQALVAEYVNEWENRDIDRAAILRTHMVGPTSAAIQDAIEWAKSPEKYLVDLGATPEQASNLIAVGSAMQLLKF